MKWLHKPARAERQNAKTEWFKDLKGLGLAAVKKATDQRKTTSEHPKSRMAIRIREVYEIGEVK
jgi:hypothetical protein